MRRALEHSRAFLVPVSVTRRKLPREKRRAQPAVLKVVRLEDGNDTLGGLGAYLGKCLPVKTRLSHSVVASVSVWGFCMDMNRMDGMESNEW